MGDGSGKPLIAIGFVLPKPRKTIAPPFLIRRLLSSDLAGVKPLGSGAVPDEP
jgi:hypothetical protein